MSPLVGVAVSSVQDTERLVSFTIVHGLDTPALWGWCLVIVIAPFLRYYFGKIGY